LLRHDFRTPGRAALNQQRYSASKNEPPARIRNFDQPDAKRSARMDRPGLDRNYASGNGPQVISVDFDPDGRNLCKVGSCDDSNRSRRLGKIHRNSAVHYSGVLMNLWSNRHFQDDAFGCRCLDRDAEKLKQFVRSNAFNKFVFVHFRRFTSCSRHS
jgi:hypothetical protein